MLEGGIEGGREVRAVREGKEGAREGGRNQLLLIRNDIKIKCILKLHKHYTDQHAGMRHSSNYFKVE